MKKVKLTKGLSLNKETVSRLSDKKMAQINGGAGPWTYVKCRDRSGIEASKCCGASLLWCHTYGCENS